MSGFRYGSEAFWLAGFALEGGVPRTAADLGTGSGIVALLLASVGVAATGFDARSEWSPLWKLTLAGSWTKGPVDLRVGDVAGSLPGRFELVTANPPFFAADAGPASPDPLRGAARTESTATLARFVEAGLAMLSEGGRLCLVLPRGREREVAGPVSRVAQIGRVRSLIELTPGFSGIPQRVALAPTEPRALSWFSRFGAGFPADAAR